MTLTGPLRGTPLHGWVEADVNSLNWRLHTRTCPVHGELLVASFSEGRWNCPHGDMMMQLDDLDVRDAAPSLGYRLDAWDPTARTAYIGTTFRLPAANTVMTGSPRFNVVWALCGAVLMLTITNTIRPPFPALVATVCALAPVSELLWRYSRRRRGLGVPPVRQEVPAGFSWDDGTQHPRCDDDLVGIPGSHTIVRRAALPPQSRNRPAWVASSLRDLLLTSPVRSGSGGEGLGR